MKKELKGIDEKTVVHCPTEALANQVLKIAHESGYKWQNGKSYLDNNWWRIFEDQICYDLIRGYHGRFNYWKNNDYKIIQAQDFINMNTTREIKIAPETIGLRVNTPNGPGTIVGIIKHRQSYLVKHDNWYNGHNAEVEHIFTYGDRKGIENCNGYFYVKSELTVLETQSLDEDNVTTEDKEPTYSVSREALKEVHSKVCKDWKSKIESLLTANLFESNVTIMQDDIRQAWKEANEDHKKWLSHNGLVLPKKKVKKTLERWVNIYPDGQATFYDTKERAENAAFSVVRLDCVKITIPYEVEE